MSLTLLACTATTTTFTASTNTTAHTAQYTKPEDDWFINRELDSTNAENLWTTWMVHLLRVNAPRPVVMLWFTRHIKTVIWLLVLEKWSGSWVETPNSAADQHFSFGTFSFVIQTFIPPSLWLMKITQCDFFLFVSIYLYLLILDAPSLAANLKICISFNYKIC